MKMKRKRKRKMKGIGGRPGFILDDMPSERRT
jgi:hypothetical protein